MTKFRTKFTLLDIKPPTRLRRVRNEENIAAVSVSVNDDHQLSIRRRSQQLGLCYSTEWKILRKDLGQNTAGARIEAERPTATLNGILESWPKIHFFLSKNSVQRRSSFLAQWVRE